MTDLIQKLTNPHKCDYRIPVIHKGKYWMKCVNEKCDKVSDTYLRDFSTDKIERLTKEELYAIR